MQTDGMHEGLPGSRPGRGRPTSPGWRLDPAGRGGRPGPPASAHSQPHATRPPGSLLSPASWLLSTLLAVSAAAAEPSLEEIRGLLQAKRLPEAQAQLEQRAASHPAEAEVHFLRGDLALRRDDRETAVTALERAVALEPGAARYQRRLGDAYGRAAQKASLFNQLSWAKKSLAAYRRAAELAPRDLEAQTSLFDYYRLAPAIAGGGPERAREQAEVLAQIDPVRGHHARAALRLADKKPAEAMSELEAGLRGRPDDYSLLYGLGRVAGTTGEGLERGLAALTRCLGMTPPEDQPGHATVHWRRAQILERLGERRAALAACEEALRLDPGQTAAAAALKRLRAAAE
jgi:tetratricopeptide (TPR) repeat protein